MTRDQAERLIRETLFEIAPDLEGEAIDPQATWREQFEVDSMDFLNFVVALGKKTGLAMPEADYPRLQTLAAATDYLLEQRPG